MTYQLVLYGGMVVDGSGAPARKGTGACKDGKITLLPAQPAHGRQNDGRHGALDLPRFY